MKLGVQLTCALAIAALGISSCNSGSDSEGTFNLAFAPPDGSGFASGDIDVGFDDVVTQDFDLPVGHTITGQVTDGAGTPLENVDISFRRAADSTEDLAGDTTDATGAYTLVVPSGTWVAVLETQDDALGTMTVAESVVSADATVDFQFPATVTVPGVVYESDAITPIPGADLEFTGTTTGANASVTTDGVGAYAVSVVPDAYHVVVTPNGVTSHLKQRFATTVTGATIKNFTLSRGIQVTGTVLTNLGLPILEPSEIRVLLPANSEYFAPAGVTADQADGGYSIDLVPPGTVTFEVEPPGDTGSPRQHITRQIIGPTTETEDLSLAAGYVLSGTILQDDGVTPEPNVEVKAIPNVGAMLPPNYSSGDDGDDTDGAGQFAISLFPGTYDVQIVPEATNLQLPELRTFPVMSNVVLNVVLVRGAMLTGTVTVPAGATPAPDIRVEIPGAFKARGVTDGAGVYSFMAPIGTHTLDLTAQDGQFEHVALDSVTGVVVAAPGPVTQDITLSVSVAGDRVVQGTLYAPDGVTPVSGAVVTATDNQTGKIIGVGTTDAGGEYLIVLMD